MKPNILFINVDQMRADCLSAMNHPVIETPNLDKLARSGVIFNNAYAATPTCVPARASILTGMKPENHGRVGYEDEVPWNYAHTLPGELAAAGYHTQCIGKMHVYPTRNLCGFHNVVLHDGYMHYNRMKNTASGAAFNELDDYTRWLQEKTGSQTDLLDTGLDCNASTTVRPWEMPEAYHPTNWTVSESIDFLRRRDPSKPFFLKMSFVRPHPPFDPPHFYYNQYVDEDLPDPVIGDWVVEDGLKESGIDPLTKHGIVPEKRLHRAKAAYYALISHIDNQIGRFMQVLNEHGEMENTVILFASDHGEMLGDHHRFAKALPYEASAKIPFFVSDPGNVLGLDKGTHVDEVVELRDIMPTLLDAANVPIPNTVDGMSLLPLGRGEHPMWRDFIHGEHAFGQDSHHFLTNGQEKYIWYSQTGEEQYFNLVPDPNERYNVAADPAHAERVAEWRAELVTELTGREEGYTDGEKLIAGKEPQAVLAHLRDGRNM